MRITPYYEQKGIKNPFYILSPPVVSGAVRELKKNGDEYKNIKGADILFKCVEPNQLNGPIIYKATSSSSKIFQITDKSKNDIPFGVATTAQKIHVIGHYGMTTRKNATASSNVNEFLSVYFLVQPPMKPDELVNYVSQQKGNTGVLKGEGTPVTFSQLADLLDEDETPERDINIGLNNARAIQGDISGRSIRTVYWVPKKKPRNVNPTNPSDTVVEFNDGFLQGYSNKIASGTDKTPKFNTNVNAFYKEMGDFNQLMNVQKLLNDAFFEAKEEVKGENAKEAIDFYYENEFENEAYGETGSQKNFGELSEFFRMDGLDFNRKDFYYPFRNKFIRKFAEYLKNPTNMVYFLRTIYKYTYGDPTQSFTPCPYKLLIGTPMGASTLKNVSSDESLKELLFNEDPSRITDIDDNYNDLTQGWDMTFKFLNGKVKDVTLPIVARTRFGGLQGKAFFLSSSGVKMK
tara:strand:- start:106 stop:1488 length:1383 start_codon:yes stop_codon:yes gene_type:complete